MEKNLILGCIADDFTGASDAASFLVQGGLRTLLFNGIPHDLKPSDTCQAIVIALKTRTQETTSAVAETLQAAAWLKARGARQLYIKYCSTFDSTPQGNIGPIMDALLETYKEPYTILCPALPVNGRTVSRGHLYVNGIPLHESSMKNHPLTPMWDSSIARLMEPQSRYECLNITRQDYTSLSETAVDKIIRFGYGREHYYVIPDYEQETDAVAITRLFGNLPILSGGSGLLAELARFHATAITHNNPVQTGTCGPGLLLAGSCSEMTRKQITYARLQGIASLQIQPLALMAGTQTFSDLLHFLGLHKGQSLLFYSSDTPENVRQVQQSGREAIAQLLESTTAKLAKEAVESGYTRIIVAGGETSGAVTRALNYDSYMIGESVAPGVPVMIPQNSPDIRLVLKSGNFGQPDFFLKALQLTEYSDSSK